MRPTPVSTMRLTVPRQPAWKAATTRCLRSATRTGMQSAVCTASSRPGSAVMWPSARRGLCRPASARAQLRRTRFEWNCLRARDKGCGVAGDGFGQQAAVGEDCFAVVGRGEAEIGLGGGARRNGRGSSALPGAKSLQSQEDPTGNRDPFDGVGAQRGTGRAGGALRELRGRNLTA